MKNHALGSIAHPTGWLIPTLPSHDSFTIGGRRRVPVVWMSSAPSVDACLRILRVDPFEHNKSSSRQKKGGNGPRFPLSKEMQPWRPALDLITATRLVVPLISLLDCGAIVCSLHQRTMSASHRKLIRLPLEVFEDLLISDPQTEMTAQDLRFGICERLKRFRVKSKYGVMNTRSVTTVGDLLRTPRYTLLMALDPMLTFGEIELMLKRICLQCSARPVTSLALLSRTTTDLTSLTSQQQTTRFQSSMLTQSQSQSQVEASQSFLDIGDRMRYLETGLPSLDGKGGIRLGNITEVVGRAGAGKTQFALQLVLMAAKYKQSSIYIDTEKKLSLARLKEMAAGRWSQHQQQGNEARATLNDNDNDQSTGHRFCFKHPDTVLQNMTVKQPNSTEELLDVLGCIEEEILHRNQQQQQGAAYPVRLLIVDSIAAPLKRDFGSNAVPQRAATAFSIAQTLKRYADQLHLAVIVINQVGIEQQGQPAGGMERRHDQVAVRAALGTSWHHCVSTRILVDHEVDPHREGWKLGHSSQWRSLSVVKSSWMPFTNIHFEITPIGIHEIRRTTRMQEDDETRDERDSANSV